jgi:hypothetical protein
MYLETDRHLQTDRAQIQSRLSGGVHGTAVSSPGRAGSALGSASPVLAGNRTLFP